jgi:hypothetical protein
VKSLTTCYTFHGLRINISGDAVVSASIHSRLKQFATNGHEASDLTFEFYAVPDGKRHSVDQPTGRVRPVYEFPCGEVLYVAAQDQLYLNYEDRVRVLCDLVRGHAQVSLLQPEVDNLWLASHLMFTVPLIESLKRHGRYSLHAAGLCIDGQGLLVAGASGSGKSTLTVALLRAGFGFLGDDMIFLSPGQDGLRALAFPDEIDLTDETARLFPELHYLLRSPKNHGWRKRQVRAEEVYEVNTIWECKPAVIVFPSIANAEKSVLKPIDRGEALLELVPNILLTEVRSSQAHLNVLGQLVKESECYRLEAGRDFDALPILLRDLMA